MTSSTKILFGTMLIWLIASSYSYGFLKVGNSTNNSTDDNKTDPVPTYLENIIKTLNGFCNTSGIYENIPTIKEIKGDEYLVLQEFFEAFDIFKDIEKDNYIEVIIKGTAKISELFNKVADILENTLNLNKEITTLAKKIIKNLKDKEYYKKLVEHMFSYDLFRIFSLVDKIRLDKNDGKYFIMGQDMGELFDLLYIPSNL